MFVIVFSFAFLKVSTFFALVYFISLNVGFLV